MDQLISGLIPAVAVILFICFCDRRKPEPLKQIWKAVLFGVLSIPLALFGVACIEFTMALNGYDIFNEIPFIRGVYQAFFSAAIPEEVAKLIMLWLFLRKNEFFDEYLDGIVYAVCVGMGFAGLENVMYLADGSEWQTVAVVRGIMAVPGHYIFAVLMGYYYSLVHFAPEKFGKYRFRILLDPILAHGAYDGLLMFSEGNEILSIIGFLVVIVLCIFLHKKCFARIAVLQRLDQNA